MDEKWAELEPTIEEYNKVHNDLKANQKKRSELEAKMKPLNDQMKAAVDKVGVMANRSYRAGPASGLNSILQTSSPTALTDQLIYLDRLAEGERQDIEAVTAARSEMDKQKAALDKVVSEQEKRDKELADKKTQVEKELDELEKLQEEAYGSVANVPSSGSTSPSDGNCSSSGASGVAATVVATACAQLGKPYVFGAAGPGSFDCSGLVAFSYAAAGISLPHSTVSQWNMGTSIPADQAQKGDVVFFNSSLSHDGIYLGNGMMVHAPQPGMSVEVLRIDVMPVVGFRRYG
ncbi:C40 family peptidase [Catenuloplanes atrovinosus]|uniref:Cell wall-associated NlpC family hydrolase n=1 Tax=Catenuloplanes atrovinosus TaxID=137266 RepID=A0AAE3YXP6_9ACTN|nr:NlpC/P60 family protein [Catenuloplanes atrovinosus]MDR7280119.1 cell wall-associated NlpC family hydrolase [Catenuloplanes atrovinosus]